MSSPGLASRWLILAAVTAGSSAAAYEVVPAGQPGEYLKWGLSRRAGTGDGSATLRPTYLWRTPRADDIAGARFLYGAPKAPSR